MLEGRDSKMTLTNPLMCSMHPSPKHLQNLLRSQQQGGLKRQQQQGQLQGQQQAP
uniref:Alternative protein FAM71A n=1 Tax=Homo sapiens TaxID=9606 RepID=L8ECN6_HUMAN|nr:alternative protein FAM71A [Homo sapiens]